ncbi:MAG: hypothetical protein AB7F86_08140 [Bdellovibrionales bacterium]
MRITLAISTLILGFALYQYQKVSPKQTSPDAALENMTQAPPALVPAPPIPSVENAQELELPPPPKATLEEQAEKLESEIADLHHEIKQGDYVRQINSESVAPQIKEELRARVRLMVSKTIELTRVQMRRMDQGS